MPPFAGHGVPVLPGSHRRSEPSGTSSAVHREAPSSAVAVAPVSAERRDVQFVAGVVIAAGGHNSILGLAQPVLLRSNVGLMVDHTASAITTQMNHGDTIRT